MSKRKAIQNNDEKKENQEVVSKEDGPRAKKLKAIQQIIVKQLVNFFENKEAFQKKFASISSSRPELFSSIQKKIVENLQTSLQVPLLVLI